MNKQDNTIEELRLVIERLQAENSALLKLASHDLRAPLNKIYALTNLLKMTDDSLSGEQQGYIDNIEVVLSDGLRLMRNMTELRAIESDELKVQRQNIDIAALVRKIVREFEPAAEKKHIKIVTDIVPVESVSDSLVISRPLDQLISNALKFSPPNSEIGIQLQAGEDKFSIIVVDGGFGIKEEEQPGLFKKFVVLSSPVTGGESKTGIGLYIAQRSANMLGGQVSYSNKNGSSFILELPVTRMA